MSTQADACSGSRPRGRLLPGLLLLRVVHRLAQGCNDSSGVGRPEHGGPRHNNIRPRRCCRVHGGRAQAAVHLDVKARVPAAQSSYFGQL